VNSRTLRSGASSTAGMIARPDPGRSTALTRPTTRPCLGPGAVQGPWVVVSDDQMKTQGRSRMKRLLWAIIGCLLFTAGVLFVTLSLVAAVRHHDARPLLLALVGLGAATFGVLWLKMCPYEVSWDTRGLSLRFVFTRGHVRWEQADSYKYVSFRGTFHAGKSNIWVLLTHGRVDHGSSRVMLLLPGTGPAFALRSRHYVTALDEFIPGKKK
jgi:hypothetical protein